MSIAGLRKPAEAVGGSATDPLADWRAAGEPYYLPSGDEIAAFEAAYALRSPVLLKGPTGCGKTRFVEHMAWRLGRPLVTVACHEDLTAGDLVGRWLLDAEGTRWHDGPLTMAVRHGAICYLDEIVEARPDTTVVLHPLTDARRLLPLDRRNELLRTRRLEAEGLDQGASTRMLVHAGALIGQGIAPRAACLQAIALPLSDAPDLSIEPAPSARPWPGRPAMRNAFAPGAWRAVRSLDALPDAVAAAIGLAGRGGR